MATNQPPPPNGAARDEADEALAERDHKRVQWLLRIGLGASAALMTAGMALRMARGEHTSPPVRLFDMRAAPDLGLLLIASGILALAMTPAVRVLALVWIWTRERDWRFVAVAVAVAATLTVAIAVGRG